MRANSSALTIGSLQLSLIDLVIVRFEPKATELAARQRNDAKGQERRYCSEGHYSL
jgi:hypothetical protein